MMDEIVTGILRIIRQVCLLPYILIVAVGCGVICTAMCLWDQMCDEWECGV